MGMDSVITSIEPLADGLVVVPRGDIDFSRSPMLRTELMQVMQEKKPRRLVVDLSEVEYMDSSGVAALIEALSHQRKGDAKLILCSLQPKVVSMFQVVRLDRVFTITADRETALTD